jgi:hypothetical protein
MVIRSARDQGEQGAEENRNIRRMTGRGSAPWAGKPENMVEFQRRQVRNTLVGGARAGEGQKMRAGESLDSATIATDRFF